MLIPLTLPRLFTGGVALLALAAAAAPVAAQSTVSGKVYLLGPNAQVTRFEEYDKPGMLAAIAEHAPGLELVVLSADNDPARQLEQAQAAITEGAKAIILAPAVPNQSQAIVQAGHDAGIPVIGYAYNSDNSDIDYYVTVPFRPIGVETAKYAIETLKDVDKPLRLGLIEGDPSFFFDREIADGMDEVLQPLIDAGEVELICRTDNLLLSTENALVATQGCIEQAAGDVDAFLVHNDSSATGVVAALTAQGLNGTVKVFGGYDSQVGNIQDLLLGNLENDMVPPYAAMAESAIQLVVALLEGSGAEADMVNGVYANGMKDVPTIFNSNVFITRNNVQAELIDTDILSKDEICTGPAAGVPLCQ